MTCDQMYGNERFLSEFFTEFWKSEFVKEILFGNSFSLN
jgi:hypothetical protein